MKMLLSTNFIHTISSRTMGPAQPTFHPSYFNLIFLIFTILLVLVQSYHNLTFLPVIVGNILIGIIQEIRSKKILDKLTVLNTTHATVVREGSETAIATKDLVLDDIVIFKAGDQVPADAQVIYGTVKANESLLTGESDEVPKATDRKS